VCQAEARRVFHESGAGIQMNIFSNTVKKILFIFCLVIVSSGCNAPVEKNYLTPSFTFPRLTDEKNYPPEYYYSPHDPVRAMHPVLAIKNVYDRIAALDNFNLRSFSEPFHKVSAEAPGLKIIVDTASHLSDPLGARVYTQAVYILNDREEPVYLDVFSTSDMTAPQASYMHMIVEAMDTSHAWRPVEFWDVRSASYSSCMRLPPKSYLITKGTIYMGDYRTMLHYKIKVGNKVYYSDPFPGRVNIDQFNYNWPHITDARLDFSLSDEFFLRDTL
jgi:hypothetical protein